MSAGRRLYDLWCQSSDSDQAGYYQRMNPADQQGWERLAEVAAERDRFRLAATALAKMVLEELPPGYSVVEAAEIWGVGVTVDELAALHEVLGNLLAPEDEEK